MSTPETDPLSLPSRRLANEGILRQRAHVIWLFGLSGAGKTTLADALARRLEAAGRVAARLDGDEIRAGLNRDLAFGDADRTENLRRVAEVARLFLDSGVVVVCSFITPREAQRLMIRRIVGTADLVDIHVDASFSACARRDPKGLYARAEANLLPQFTGRDSAFEMPPPGSCRFVLNTESEPATVSAEKLARFVLPLVGAESD